MNIAKHALKECNKMLRFHHIAELGVGQNGRDSWVVANEIIAYHLHIESRVKRT